MVNWLVVGVGDIAKKRVIPAILAEPRSNLYGVVTRDARKADAYPGTAAWATLDAALQDDAIDAVYISSPVVMHAEQTISALRAGKHVLCEKPVAMHYAQAQEMAAAGRVSGKLFGVSYYRRLYPKLIRAKELIAQGAIGQPVLAEANCHGWLESEERGWLRHPEMAGGGPLYDIGSHRIDAMNFLFGKPQRATGLLSNAVHAMAVEGLGHGHDGVCGRRPWSRRRALELPRRARPVPHHRQRRRDEPRPAGRAGTAACRSRGDAAYPRERALSVDREFRRSRTGREPAGLHRRRSDLDGLGDRTGGQSRSLTRPLGLRQCNDVLHVQDLLGITLKCGADHGLADLF